MQETWIWSLGWEDPLEKRKAHTSVFWPWEIHGLYSLLGHKELDSTEWLSLSLTFMITMCAKSLQSCPTLCHPMNCSPPGSSFHGVLQARVLEWVAVPSSRGSSPPRDQTCISYVSCIGRQSCFFATNATWQTCMGAQKAQNSQSNLEKENQSWRNQFPWL